MAAIRPSHTNCPQGFALRASFLYLRDKVKLSPGVNEIHDYGVCRRHEDQRENGPRDVGIAAAM
jgi:hypothetical protein